MGIFSLFRKKEDKIKTGGMQDYMMLVRVYFQAAIASGVGITNIAMLPVVLCQDLKQIKMRIFQRRIVKPSATLLKNEPHMVFYNLDISSDAGSA